MTNSNCSVLMKQQHCLRFSHNIASSYHNALFAAYIYSAFLYKLHNTGRRTWNKIIIPNHYFPYIYRMKCVNVLLRGNRVYNSFFVYMLRYGKLHQYARNTVLIIKRVYKLQQFLLRGCIGKRIFFRVNPTFLTCAFLISYINLTCRVLTDDDYREPRCYSLFFQLFYFCL